MSKAENSYALRQKLRRFDRQPQTVALFFFQLLLSISASSVSLAPLW
jgi:hypothetical protein